MKKAALILLSCLIFLTGCQTNETSSKDTFEYTDDWGKTSTLNKNPKRIVVLGYTYAGSIKQLGGNIVGVNELIDNSALLKEEFKDVEKIKSNNIDHIKRLKPDLIITYSSEKKLSKLRKIAPTVSVEYRERDYIEQHKELGKIINKTEEANKWVDNWNKENKTYENEIKPKLGKNKTFAIVREYQDHIYAIGNGYSSGCEVIFDAFNLKMSKSFSNLTDDEGYKIISKEELTQIDTDYIISIAPKSGNLSFQNAEEWKALPAIKKHHQIKVNETIYWFNDAISLEYQRDDLKNKLLASNKK